MKINYPKSDLYPEETCPWPTYLEINPRTKVLSADWDSGTGWTAVWSRKLFRWSLPSVYLKREAIVRLMDRIAPLASRICDDEPGTTAFEEAVEAISEILAEDPLDSDLIKES